MRKREVMKTAVERIAYEEGYQDGVDSMFSHWCALRSKNAEYAAEIHRLREALAEKLSVN